VKPSLFRRSTRSFLRGTSRFNLKSSQPIVDTACKSRKDPDAPLVCAPTRPASGNYQSNAKPAVTTKRLSSSNVSQPVVFFRQDSL
jgi:hypothetical protein